MKLFPLQGIPDFCAVHSQLPSGDAGDVRFLYGLHFQRQGPLLLLPQLREAVLCSDGSIILTAGIIPFHLHIMLGDPPFCGGYPNGFRRNILSLLMPQAGVKGHAADEPLLRYLQKRIL